MAIWAVIITHHGINSTMGKPSHPATSGREYDHEEMEFLRALDAEVAKRGRRITSFVEVFHILKELGYSRMPKPIDFSHRSNVVFASQEHNVIEPQLLEIADAPGQE